MVWIQLGLCAAFILISGSLLSRYGDMLAEKTGMGRTWIGLILLATVTSLPELSTGLSSVRFASAPEIAVGDVMGSCVFNLMLIGVIDFFNRPNPILSRGEHGQILSAGFSICLVGLASWGLLMRDGWGSNGIFWIGLYTPLILVLYLVAMRTLFQYERKRMDAIKKTEVASNRYGEVSRKQIYWNVGIHSMMIVGAGIWLPFIGGEIAERTGWGQTFVGNLFVAATTSLPEIVTSIAAVLLGAPNMAIANIFGSNLFNMLVLALDDLMFLEGPLLFHVSSYHLFSAVTTLIMTGVAMIGMIRACQGKVWKVVSVEGVSLILLYLANAYWLYILGRPTGE